MMTIRSIVSLLMIAGSFSCQAQTKQQMEESKNPLLCDPLTGVCETPLSQSVTAPEKIKAGKMPVSIIYFTDPICSSCWGIEPQLRKLKLEYGDQVNIEYHMGGLLPDWNYNSGGISKPSDVAHHWDEVSAYYNMPIDGDVWLEDPLSSSYPPSIAFKAAQLQDKAKAIAFLRVIREMVFLEKKNITQWPHLAAAATQTGLDTIRLKQDYENEAKTLFQVDLALAKSMGVRGFPSVFVSDGSGKQEFVYGFKPYAVFEQAITQVYPQAAKKKYDKTWNHLFAQYPTLTSREFAELSGQSITEGEAVLTRLVQQKELIKLDTKNGPLWKREKIS